jgi:nitroreductase
MMSDFDLKTVDRLLSTTRSVRRRLDLKRPVPRDVVLDCLRLSQQAPTAHNSQTWRWILVDDPHIKRQLGEIYAQALPAIEKASADADDHHVDEQTKKVYSGAVWFASHIGEVPLLAIACLTERLPPDAALIHAATFFGSIYQAVWSFQLALRSRGLGSTFTTAYLFFEDQVRDLLGIPKDVTQVALLPIGYTTGGDFKPAQRPPVDSIVHWNRW